MKARPVKPAATRQVAFRLPIEIADRIRKIEAETNAASTTEVVVALLYKALDMKTLREKMGLPAKD